MKRLFRTTTALSALLAIALQLPSAGAAAACQVQMESHMAEMVQSASILTGHADNRSIASPPMPEMTESQQAEEHPPCGDDADRDACVEMAACQGNLTILSHPSAATGHRAPTQVAVRAVAGPLSLVLPPEPPPPRL